MAIKNVKKTPREYTASCVSCGTLVTEEQKFVSEGRNYCTNCAILSKKKEPGLTAPAGVVKWICYMVSFLSPFAGFVLGIVFLSQHNDEPSRSFGRHCLIIMCVSLVLILFFVAVSVIMGVTGMGQDYGGPNIVEGYY